MNSLVVAGALGGGAAVAYFGLRQRAVDWGKANLVSVGTSPVVTAQLVLKANLSMPYPQFHWDIYADGVIIGTTDLFSNTFFEVPIL